ncbi:MAG: hypothetical protein NC038_00040 [Paludibacter sp.]|nr:hypothetical protein [Bacteroidales bacterium]MCM1068771.1 hypothetical protein [Prevotella sp.]MCM1354483.1 hypothetical protein [Bacteroides sp.]MCM1443286.1 hypothetical protein [Muribaculum sp.]MCM1481029.1 hypothetical protein [Paludibacter sp.]
MAKQESFFWTSYSDLMTSMFFIMLVLFVLVVALLHRKIGDIDAERKATTEQLQVIKEIEEATHNIDSTYFVYNPEYKKHVLNITVQFKTGIADMDDIDSITQNDLIKAGESIQTFIEKITEEHPEVQYLLVIEGQASKDAYQKNYELSYRRALALKQLWDDRCIRFGKKCEVVIGGNGDGKLSGTNFMREEKESKNQRFLIHILPKTSIPEK